MKAKTFDCVEMKHEIQCRLRKERGGRSWAERNRMIRQALRDDPHLARLLDTERPPATTNRAEP